MRKDAASHLISAWVFLPIRQIPLSLLRTQSSDIIGYFLTSDIIRPVTKVSTHLTVSIRMTYGWIQFSLLPLRHWCVPIASWYQWIITWHKVCGQWFVKHFGLDCGLVQFLQLSRLWYQYQTICIVWVLPMWGLNGSIRTVNCKITYIVGTPPPIFLTGKWLNKHAWWKCKIVCVEGWGRSKNKWPQY